MSEPMELYVYSKDIDLLYLELKKYEGLEIQKENDYLALGGEPRMGGRYRSGAGGIPLHFVELEKLLGDFSTNHESVKLSYVVGCGEPYIYDCTFTNGESKSFGEKPITPEEIKKRMGLSADAIVIPSKTDADLV